MKEEEKTSTKNVFIGLGFSMLIKSAVVSLVAALFSFQVMASGTVLIDGKEIKNHDQLHNLIAKQLNFPHFYGKTLDSLYDILSTDYSGYSVIKIKHVSILKAKLGTEYIEGMIQAIMDAAEDNARVILVLE